MGEPMRLHPAVVVWALGALSTIAVTVAVLQFDVALPLWIGVVCVLVTASSPIVWIWVQARRVLASSAVLVAPAPPRVRLAPAAA